MDTQQRVARVLEEMKAGLAKTSQPPVSKFGHALVAYTRSVAGLEKLCQGVLSQGGRASLLIPKYGHYGINTQRIRESGVRVLTLESSSAEWALPGQMAGFTCVLLPGLHEVAVRESGGIVDLVLAWARAQNIPMIALHEPSETASPEWLPSGVAWQSLASFTQPQAKGPSADELARMIDHTLLRADATREDIDRLCQEAAEWKFASVCVNPSWVARAAKSLKGTGVMVCTVVGFPLGANDGEVKAEETRRALAHGADEIDMVLNVGALKSKDYETVARDIAAVVKAAGGKTVKVILETGHLTEEEKSLACLLAQEAGAHFVKTSTGFGPGGATAADISLMRRLVGMEMGVKASGGIRDTATALKMVAAGANRIGASASISIVTGNVEGAAASGY